MQKKSLLYLISSSIIFFLPHLELIPLFGYSIPIFILILISLKLENSSLSDIGFSFSKISIKSVLTGLLAGILIFLFLQLLFWPIVERFTTPEYNDIGILDFLEQGLGSYIFLVTMGFVIGGFYEELMFHGYIFTRLEKIIPGKYSFISSFLIANLIFALYHFQLGSAGVINAFIAGLFYHFLSIYFKRNLWYSIICHGTYNGMIFTFYYFDLF